MLRYAVLIDAVLIVGLKEKANRVRIVSVRPHSRIGDVVCEVLVGPEHLGLRGACLVDQCVNGWRRLDSKPGLQRPFLPRRRGARLGATWPIILPRVLGMASHAVHEDDAAIKSVASVIIGTGVVVLDAVWSTPSVSAARELCESDAVHWHDRRRGFRLPDDLLPRARPPRNAAERPRSLHLRYCPHYATDSSRSDRQPGRP